ncbi:hypothetical protein BJP27_24075 (plasmid) [Pseudomonas oryzihabitans]|nr:hypothetical protein BJP27_24075 [Pseudomonas psychrotolerans]
MPKLISNVVEAAREFAHLDELERNSALYAALSAAPAPQNLAGDVQHPIPPGYRLLRIDGRLPPSSLDRFEIALLCDTDQSVVYYNRVIIQGHVDLGCRPATQSLVWRTTRYAHGAVLRDLASRVFFDYILASYDVIMSDSQQTIEGHSFWRRKLSEALARQLHVYHFRFIPGTLVGIPDEKALDEACRELWGETEAHADYLAIISRHPLPKDLTIEAA